MGHGCGAVRRCEFTPKGYYCAHSYLAERNTIRSDAKLQFLGAQHHPGFAPDTRSVGYYFAPEGIRALGTFLCADQHAPGTQHLVSFNSPRFTANGCNLS